MSDGGAALNGRGTARAILPWVVFGDLLPTVADRSGRSMTWIREMLQRLAVRHRSFGVQPPAESEKVVRLRDEESLSSAEIRTAAGVTETTLIEIRAAYWAGQTLEDLSDQWGVSPKTIAIWVYRD